MSEEVKKLKPTNVDFYNPIKDKFSEIVDNVTFAKEVSFAAQLVRASPQLQQADANSTLTAVMNVAQIGLSLNPAKKEAYLLPRWNNRKRCVETCLEPSYQGLVKLATNTGSVKTIYCHVVYEGDEFEVSLGTSTEIKHKPKFSSKNITHVYSVSVLHDGTKQIEVMTYSDISEIKERSESYKAYKAGKISSCVWTTDEGEMCRKTVIRRAVKYLPKTDMWDKLQKAIELDESDFKADWNKIHYIESLLSKSTLPHDQISTIESEMYNYTDIQANECIRHLKDNQRDPIESGDGYSQTDVRNKLKEVMSDDRK